MTPAIQLAQTLGPGLVMMVILVMLTRRVLSSLERLEQRVDEMHSAIAAIASKLGEPSHTTWIDQQRLAEARQLERDRAADARADAARKRAEANAAALPRAITVQR